MTLESRFRGNVLLGGGQHSRNDGKWNMQSRKYGRVEVTRSAKVGSSERLKYHCGS